MIPLFSYLFISLALLRALFLFLFIFPTASFFYLERPLRRRSGPESLKRVLWWVPSALPQLPDPSVNWSFKTDTPRRSGRYWPTPLLHVYTFTSLHKNIWSPKQCTQTRALYRPERLSVLAVNQLSWLFSCDICQPLELLWPPFLLFIVFFSCLLYQLYFTWFSLYSFLTWKSSSILWLQIGDASLQSTEFRLLMEHITKIERPGQFSFLLLFLILNGKKFGW